MRKLVLALPLAVTTALLACGGDARRSGFEGEGLDPSNGGGPLGSSGAAPSPDDDTQCAKTEVTAQKAPVDIIMAVDQSGSMSDDIANVKANINQLSDFLKATGLDYRVVMIATPGTGSYDVCVPPPLGGPSCGSNGTTFKSVPRNVQSNDALSIIISTLAQASGPYEWGTFLRKDSIKAFIPVTDDNAYETAASFDQQLLAKPGGLFGTAQSRRYVFYPITGSQAYPTRATCGANAVNIGAAYLDLADLTKGKWFSICASSFGPVFQEIGKSVAATVACELPVPKPTDGSTIDHSRVNVGITTSKGDTLKVLQDKTKPCAGGADGWQYDATKTRILLCGPTCDKVRNDPGSKVSVQFGCETRVK